MKALELKKSIETLLEANAHGRYTVITPQNRKSDAENIFAKPQINVVYAEGSFDKNKSSVNSPYHHDPSFNINIVAGAKVKINKSVINDVNSTPEQLANALAQSTNASMEVDAKLDDLLDILFDILMRPQNRNLGTDYNTGRFVTGNKKQNPEKIGDIVIGGATITMVAQCVEEVTGETGTPGINGVDTVIEFGDDSMQGVKV